MPSDSITVVAPINIAFIKYWGKREGGEVLILPTNDSFSITLSTNKFRTRTSVRIGEDIAEDELVLNGKKRDVANDRRLQTVLGAVRATAPPELASLKAQIWSENNFPTAAGMASSASGLCALAFALVNIYKATADVSVIARLGSGSACRSAYGGFVKWLMGTAADGSDCRAEQFVDHTFWPEVQILCAVVKAREKDVSSTKGMQLSIQNSPLMKERMTTTVPRRMEEVSEMIRNRDFQRFAEITMRDSDNLQDVCRSTTPSILYATDDSFAIIRLVHAYNRAKGRIVLGYTYDAGANAFLFMLQPDLVEVVALLLHYFPTPDDSLVFENVTLLNDYKRYPLHESLRNLIEYPRIPLTYLLHSPVGCGPSILPEEQSLFFGQVAAVKETPKAAPAPVAPEAATVVSVEVSQAPTERSPVPAQPEPEAPAPVVAAPQPPVAPEPAVVAATEVPQPAAAAPQAPAPAPPQPAPPQPAPAPVATALQDGVAQPVVPASRSMYEV